MNTKKTDSNALALAVSIAVSIIYSLCAAFLAFLPKPALKLASAVHHISENVLVAHFNISLMSFIIGLVTTFAVTYITVMLAHFFYDLLNGKKNH